MKVVSLEIEWVEYLDFEMVDQLVDPWVAGLDGLVAAVKVAEKVEKLDILEGGITVD